MSKFLNLYNADICRYKGKPSAYIRFFLLCFRKYQTSKTPLKLLYKFIFIKLCKTRGIEVSPDTKIGGVSISGTHIISRLIQQQQLAKIAIYTVVY